MNRLGGRVRRLRHRATWLVLAARGCRNREGCTGAVDGRLVVTMLDVNGTQLFVQEVGAGPVAVVLHGGLGIDQQPYRSLDELASKLRMVYIDHRGNGRSGRPDPTTLTMTQWADDVATVAAQV